MNTMQKKWVKNSLATSSYYIEDPITQKGKWQDLFPNNNPIHLEFDCEEGVFISNMARYNPNINFLAVSANEVMLASTMKNVKSVFEGQIPQNLKLLKFKSEDIDKIFDFKDKIDRIYINFPAAWEKPKHHKNRLTYPKQLYKYRRFLKSGGDIFLKTDSEMLYTDSIGYFKEAKFEIVRSTDNLDRENIFRSDEIIVMHEHILPLQGIIPKGIIARSNKL